MEIERYRESARKGKEKMELVSDALGGNNEDIVLNAGGKNGYPPMHHFETMGGLDCKSGLKTFSRGDQRWARGACVRDIL